MPIEVRGVYPIEADQPVHLIEIAFSDGAVDFDFGEITQANVDVRRGLWQVAYNEEPLEGDRRIWSFFFHYLDFSKPLLTPDGPVSLPAPTALPEHFHSREYYPP